MKYLITTIFVNNQGDFVDFGGWSNKKIGEARKYGKKLALKRNEVIRMFRLSGTYNPANPRRRTTRADGKSVAGQFDAQEIDRTTENVSGKMSTADTARYSDFR